MVALQSCCVLSCYYLPVVSLRVHLTTTRFYPAHLAVALYDYASTQLRVGWWNAVFAVECQVCGRVALATCQTKSAFLVVVRVFEHPSSEMYSLSDIMLAPAGRLRRSLLAWGARSAGWCDDSVARPQRLAYTPGQAAQQLLPATRGDQGTPVSEPRRALRGQRLCCLADVHFMF